MEQLQTASREMDSPPPPLQEQCQSQSASTSAAPQPVEAAETPSEREKEMLHRTKVIQFLGRTTPIILQNDNGPCPLLAICNVLSLKNSLNLSPDIPEVSQEKLLSLVAERLIDSNSNNDNKDSGYLENQQQNISDAIDLLPRLATGIDVNIKFRRIDDFEFTPECAIFDLLDIPLYHGWIVDPQDSETADAIGSKSYNTLMEELVLLDMQTLENKQKNNPDDDDVDFAAATTATLGVPSPSLSRGQSFDGSPTKARKGDMEEEEELLRVLKLSTADVSNLLVDGVVANVNFHEITPVNNSIETRDLQDEEKSATEEPVEIGLLISEGSNLLSNHQENIKSPILSQEGQENSYIHPTDEESRNRSAVLCVSDACTVNGKIPLSSEHGNRPCDDELRCNNHSHNEIATSSDPDKLINHENGSRDRTGLSNTAVDSDSANGQILNADDRTGLSNTAVDSDSANRQILNTGGLGAFSTIVDGSEPIYEGEECILDSGTQAFANREPIYEGELVLAEQVDRGCIDDGDHNNKERVSVGQGEIIRNFLKINASQLTIYGLFCLRDKVKERELSVFFRNNHFNTMFKYEGELYILATDQGYINQPDLVWEKLNEVNGDTVYMRSNFKEFKMDDHSNSTWDEQNAMARTADYLASIDGTRADSSFSSDLQLAMALQQQEFEQQQQHQQSPPQSVQQSAPVGGSRLVIGPQVPRKKYTSTSKHQDSKSKETCIIM